MKHVSVSLTQEACKVYQYLLNSAPNSKQEKAILNAFLQKIELIKKTPHYWQAVAKNLIPIEYKRDYDQKSRRRNEIYVSIVTHISYSISELYRSEFYIMV
jgi:hypothetical protein